MLSEKDLKVSGSGTVAGGTFNKVQLSGSARITGDVICQKFEANGSAKVDGNVESYYIQTNGSCKINGNCSFNKMQINGSTSVSGNSKGEEIEVNGSAKFIGDINTKDCEISGSVNVEGSIYSDEIKSQGILKITKDCEGEKIYLAGAFNVNGLINGEEVEVKCGWSSTAASIGGKKITVTESIGGIGNLIYSVKNIFTGGRKTMINCDSIEGDDIYLENTGAKIVRGKNIILGKNCNIEKIEYSESFVNNDGSIVNEVVNTLRDDLTV